MSWSLQHPSESAVVRSQLRASARKTLIPSLGIRRVLQLRSLLVGANKHDSNNEEAVVDFTRDEDALDSGFMFATCSPHLASV